MPHANIIKPMTAEEIDKAFRWPKNWSKIFSTDVGDELTETLNKELRAAQRMVWLDPGYSLVWQFEWDVCFVLDACRYDSLNKTHVGIPGELSRIVSPGFNTARWVEATFAEPQKDVVLVTASPWFRKTYPDIEERVYYILEPWKTHWDERLETVLPGAVTGLVLDHFHRFPDKRWVIFYIQPHDPFVANKDLSVKKRRVTWGPDFHKSGRKFSSMRAAYDNNLRLALREVERCSNELPGKHVITSDHGESFGEHGVCWTHKGGPLPWLHEVPWFEVGE